MNNKEMILKNIIDELSNKYWDVYSDNTSELIADTIYKLENEYNINYENNKKEIDVLLENILDINIYY